MADPNTRQGKRTPVTLKIKFKSETLEQFIERYAVDVSQGGIFIRTKEPLAVGTQMKFEFQLRDASPLIAGEGTVVWTRENDPSRPAIAPGMGVRFDKLADGSQNVLEKILAEKAKQAPSRSNSVTAPGENKGGGGAFTDVPTRVAPAPVQEALGLRSRTDSEQTPLPKPMPFHSDAEDFDEKAFDEATKVRSLDDLAKESAALGGGGDDDGSGLDDNPKHATTLMPADQLDSHRRVSAEREAVAFHDSTPPTKSVPDRESAPALPTPPAVESAASSGPRMLDATPEPKSEPAPEPVKASPPPTPPAAAASSAPDSAAPRSVAKEPSRPTAPTRPSSAPIVIGILAALAIAGGAVWFFVLRDKGDKQVVEQPKPTPGSAQGIDNGSGSQMAGGSSTEPNGSDTGSNAGSAGSDMAMTGSNAGSAAGSAGTMAGSNAGSAATPAANVDTVITATGAKGATVEIVGTDQKGPSPFTAKLEKDKTYTARVTAPGYLANELSVKGGQKSSASLTIKPHVITINTDPPGADVFVDGTNMDRMTPTDVQLTAAQAAKPRVRITLRRPGYRQVDQMVDSASYKESDAKATTSITVKLQQQQQVVRPPNNGGGTGSGAAGSGATGGGETGTGTGGGESGSASAPPPPPPPAPAPAPAAGSAAPSGGQTLK